MFNIVFVNVLFASTLYNYTFLSNLQQVTLVGVETFCKAVQQLADRQACAGGKGVAIRAQGANQVGTSLQHGDLCVLLHYATYLGQQQVQMLEDRGNSEETKSRMQVLQ